MTTTTTMRSLKRIVNQTGERANERLRKSNQIESKSTCAVHKFAKQTKLAHDRLAHASKQASYAILTCATGRPDSSSGRPSLGRPQPNYVTAHSLCVCVQVNLRSPARSKLAASCLAQDEVPVSGLGRLLSSRRASLGPGTAST